MKIVILDAFTITQSDLSFDSLKQLDKVDKLTVYERTAPNEIAPRIEGYDMVLTSKCRLTEKIIKNATELKYIGELATGYDNIDIKAAGARGITVTNIASYSTEAVAQHTISCILHYANDITNYFKAVRNNEWKNSKDFCFFLKPSKSLTELSLGIIGYGNIGRCVANIAESLGMKVNVYSKNPAETLKSDIISLHCPLTQENEKFVNKSFISSLKDGAVLINTARGGLIDENDLKEALMSNKLTAAYLDVLSSEPPIENSLTELDNCFITPHIAWGTHAARARLIKLCEENIKAYIEGSPSSISFLM